MKLKQSFRKCFIKINVIQSEEREKQIQHINTHTYICICIDLEKWHWWTYLQGRNRDTDIKDLEVRKGKSGMNRKSSINVCTLTWGFPGGINGKEPASQCRRWKRCEFDPWVRKIPWRKATHSVFMLGESHGQRSLGGLQPVGSERAGHGWNNLCETDSWLKLLCNTASLGWYSVTTIGVDGWRGGRLKREVTFV